MTRMVLIFMENETFSLLHKEVKICLFMKMDVILEKFCIINQLWLFKLFVYSEYNLFWKAIYFDYNRVSKTNDQFISIWYIKVYLQEPYILHFKLETKWTYRKVALIICVGDWILTLLSRGVGDWISISETYCVEWAGEGVYRVTPYRGCFVCLRMMWEWTGGIRTRTSCQPESGSTLSLTQRYYTFTHNCQPMWVLTLRLTQRYYTFTHNC